MIDISSEHLLTFTEAAKEAPGRPHVATIFRWRTRGIHGIKLETALCGGRRYTSREAIQRFFSATTAAADGTHSAPQTNRQRAASISAAERELDAIGI